MRFRRRADRVREPEQVVELDAEALLEASGVFAAPRWLRDMGIASWLTVGAVGVLVGLTWLLGVTSTIVAPVLAGLLVAVVASPAVGRLHRHGLPRAVSAALVLLGLVGVGVLLAVLVVSGIEGQAGAIGEHASAAAATIQGWLEDAGVDETGASSAMESVASAVPQILETFIQGLARGISGITSLIFGLSFAVFSLFFLLKDGPAMRRWVDRRLGVPAPAARTITGGVITSLRRYFLGVTIVAAFNALVIGVGAIALGVPLVGTIALVTFVTAYIPYLGAFVAGTFAFVVALGAEGPTTAAILVLIFLLGNGPLQQLVQPFALGTTLRLHPLVVLIVTVGAGALFGMTGLVLAAPLTSAAVHIGEALARARTGAGMTPAQASGAGPPVPEAPG